MKKIFLVAQFIACFFGLLTLNSFAQAPSWQWAKTATGPSYSFGNSICIDASGNSYVVGQFNYPSITFGTITLNSNGPTNLNLFLVKYDPFGNVLWAKNAGGISVNQASSVAVDNSGNVFIVGIFSDTIIFGSTTLINTYPGARMFLAKYDPSGNVIWAKKIGGGFGDQALSVATDPSGNIYVTGSFQGTPTATFDSYTLNNSSSGVGHDIFLVKYDTFGNALWAKGYGSNSSNIAYSVTTDISGNSYITGRFTSSITFGFTTLTYGGVFLVKSDPAGTVMWAKSSSGTTDYPTGNSVSTDALGYSYITGYFYSPSVNFGSTTLVNADNSGFTCDLFLAKYGPSGNVIWAKSAGGTSYDDIGTSVSTDSLNNCYITGYFGSSSITFGSTTLNNNGSSNSRDIFLAKYNLSGNLIWAISEGGVLSDQANALAVDHSANCHVTGEFSSSTLVFGATALTNSSSNKMFIAKTGNEDGINSFTGSANGISFYPNPSSGKFNLEVIQFENGKMGSLEIYNVLGEKILSEKIISQQTEIDLSGNTKGIYYYRIFNSTKIIGSGKMIVE